MTVRTETEPVARGSEEHEVLQKLTAGNGRRGFLLKHLRCPFHVRWLLHIRPAMTLNYFACSYEIYLCVLYD